MIKLVIVDDEKITREGLLQYITWKDLGVDVVELASDGFEALEIAERLQPDILLSDIRMPDMDGIELAGKLRDILPQCTILFLSAFADKEYLKSAIHLKALHYLEKPVNREEVKSAIKDAVQAIVAEKRKRADDIDMRLRLAESSTVFKEKLVLDMINRQVQLDEIKMYFTTLQLDMPLTGDFVTALIKLDIQVDSPIEMQQKHKEQIIKSVEIIFTDPQIKHLAGFKHTNHILIHFYGESIRNPFFSAGLLEQLRNSIEHIVGLKTNLFMALGKHVHTISDVQDSYFTAAVALQKQFFIGHNQIAMYEEECESVYDLDESLSNRFLEYIKEHEQEKAKAYIRNLNADFEKNTNLLVNSIKNVFFNMLVGLNKFAEGFNITFIEDNAKKDFFWEIINKIPTLAEIEVYLLEQIDFVFAKINTMDNIGENIYQIMQYISEHFSEESLTIPAIAQNMYLTPTYVCKIFKNKTGKTINQYITEVRIEKAKELLKEEKIKLLEISHRVGYLSPNHFAKTFKKLTGMNPSEFRERHYL
ncbi:DNA-binding response regulator [Paenibacillus baekrokdamisoli]|uniref:DNA-binding response regulator n=1 Tax=Paenibacillus baekrokdamisoli TaxID=1712516 RepID=A0A3G9IS83_9BACL|nr:response regulator [Paenibacillus baekrokdamisoli]MBB3069211.1 two-component system response regulator YesN [Paenibacillus baekrokdamisoli]BBH18815.1 DNA-binding response regulator [Paenibacillus baekrokdamisoli]